MDRLHSPRYLLYIPQKLYGKGKDSKGGDADGRENSAFSSFNNKVSVFIFLSTELNSRCTASLKDMIVFSKLTGVICVS